MDKKLYIQSYCHIKNNQLWLNGKLVYKGEQNSSLKDFLKSSYRDQKMHYAKFYKMDNLSKLSILAAELILRDVDVKEFDHNIGLVFSNNASSLDTDRKYQKSIDDVEHYYPSPAVFVYTLPNIAIGEISIKHRLKSENGFFIFDKYNAEFQHNYEKLLIDNKKSTAVVSGWVNVDDEKYEAFVYLISENGKTEHTKQNLIKLYKE